MGRKRASKVSVQQLKPLRSFLRLVTQKFHPEKIILFGSRARGDNLIESDYDLLFVSAEFEKFTMYERMVEVYKLQDIPVVIDVVCLTPKEFKLQQKIDGVVSDAVREGVEI